ncbi:MAG TPA: sialidase family protein [Spirochaetota bacterium]|nr:sialidase family protein [Spirochaetota bacterium]HPV98512.1 sialidase family protein [Spirochaetota bacterium]
MKKLLKITLVLMLFIVLCALLLLLYWCFRPNAARVEPSLKLETWSAVSDGMHNSNTDMIFWKGNFYLVHANSPYHFATEKCRLMLWRSGDARSWEKLSEVNIPGEDIRDPKLVPMAGRLFLYVLKSTRFIAEPYSTALRTSADGKEWTPLIDIEPEGWLFWRPKTRDGRTWYAPAYWHEHGRSILLKSFDGLRWERVSAIHEGGWNDETAIEFLPDGRLLATARLEGSDSWLGDERASTLIATAAPPYTSWKSVESRVTRLDGPALFSYNGNLYAVGRHNPDPPGFFSYYGSILARKRTALYRVLKDRLVYLSDLPSAGDTSYAGVVIREGAAYISYYTSDTARDYPWIIGMLARSDILIARIELPRLERLAAEKMKGTP